MYRGEANGTQSFGEENLKKTHNLEDLGVDGRIFVLLLKNSRLDAQNEEKVVGSEDDKEIPGSKRELSHWTLLKRQ
jgi:hypothetical protein